MVQNENINQNTASVAASPKAKRVFFDIVNSVKGGSGKSTISLLLAAYCNSDSYCNYKSLDEEGKGQNNEDLVTEVNQQNSKTNGEEEKYQDNEDVNDSGRLNRNAVAYILDIDLKGTSWEKNYGHYITTKYYFPSDTVTLHNYYTDGIDSAGQTSEIRLHNMRYRRYPFFNTIMKDYESFRSKSFWSEINFQAQSSSKTLSSGKIKICPVSSISEGKIDQIEVDIFENTLQKLIFDILNKHLMNSDAAHAIEKNSVDDIHIIFDMPPSYEPHAEAVIKHLLTNSNSELYQKAHKQEGPFKKNDNNNYFEPYIVNFFMPCSVSNAHIEQNGFYLWNWFQNVHYSDCVFAMMMKSRIRFRFIINDISDFYSDIYQMFGKSIKEWTKEIIAELEDGGGALYYNKVQEVICENTKGLKKPPIRELRVIKHMKLPGAASLFHPAASIPPGPPLIINYECLNIIENAAADLFLEEDDDGG